MSDDYSPDVSRFGNRRSRQAVLVLLFIATVLSACGDDSTDGGSPTSTVEDTSTGASSTSEAEAASTTSTPSPGLEAAPAEPCLPAPVPASAELDPFYTQGCDLDGFWVVASGEVHPSAIENAGELASALFANDPLLAEALRSTDIRLGIIGQDQRTTEMPEYRDLNEAFPETDWDTRARGLGATIMRPLVSAGEENILCLEGDRYWGEDILLHEFSHVIHEFGYAVIDPSFQPRLDAAFADAAEQGIWATTYAAENEAEYWAEAVQSYFGRNLTSEVPDGVHGPIDTRTELADADPAIHALITEKLGSATLPGNCNN